MKLVLDLLPTGVQQLSWNHYRELGGILASLPQSPDSMAHSAAYFLHTGRKGLYLVLEGDAHAFVAIHPNKDNSLLVLPAGGCFAPALWRELCDRVSSGGWNVTLARIPSARSSSVATIECFRPIVEDALDWRFPVTVIDTERLSKPSGGTFSRFREKINKARRKGDISTIDQGSPLYAELELPLFNLISGWAHEVSETKGFALEHLISSNVAAYELGRRQIVEIVCRIYHVDERVIGFCATELPARGTTANGIAMCVDRGWTGCSEFMYWTEAKALRELGFGRYNINGSETQSLDDFRSKLRPVERIELKTYSFLGA